MADSAGEGRTSGIRTALAAERHAYEDGEHRPLGSFVGMMAAYAGAVGLGSVALRRRGLPERIGGADLALMAVATHTLSRLIAKE